MMDENVVHLKVADSSTETKYHKAGLKNKISAHNAFITNDTSIVTSHKTHFIPFGFENERFGVLQVLLRAYLKRN